MEANKTFLKSPWELINDLTDDEPIEEFELDDILIAISLNIINYRIDNNLTQKQLAVKLNISQSMVSKLESGEYNPTIEQLWKISKGLDWKLAIKFEEEISTQVWMNTNNNLIEFQNSQEKFKDSNEMFDLLAEGA